MSEPLERLQAQINTSEEREDHRFFELRDLATELAKSDGRFVPDFSDRNYVLFLPIVWDKPQLQQSAGWTLSNRILLFEFNVTDDVFQLLLTTGPGPANIREELVKHAHSHVPPFQRHDTRRQRRTGLLFTQLYRREFARPNDADSSDIEKLKEVIRSEWQRFLDEEYDAIVDVMTTAIDRLPRSSQEPAKTHPRDGRSGCSRFSLSSRAQKS